MALEVIGAGFGRTGTLSLKHALEKLGFDRCYHMEEVFGHPEHASVWSQAHRGEAVDWDALFDGYRASVDWPACNLWREQLDHFPDAKVLLSLREPDGWYESVMNTIYPSSMAFLTAEDEGGRRIGRWLSEVVWDRVFDGRVEDRQHAIRVFEAHNDAVARSVPQDKLLIYRPGDGWQPLCDFLEVPVPDAPYPHVNSTAEFRAQRPGLS